MLKKMKCFNYAQHHCQNIIYKQSYVISNTGYTVD